MDIQCNQLLENDTHSGQHTVRSQGAAQDHSRQRSRTSDRTNGVSSIDRIKNMQKSFEEYLLQ